MDLCVLTFTGEVPAASGIPGRLSPWESGQGVVSVNKYSVCAWRNQSAGKIPEGVWTATEC